MGRLIRFAPRRRAPPAIRAPSFTWLRRHSGFVAILVLAILAAVYDQMADLAAPPVAGRFHAIDGDSLRSGTREYRLKGIDAPELRQTCETADGASYNCGREAHAALRRLVEGRNVSCDPQGTDRYGRTLANCSADGHDINGRMVEDGWAVSYGSLSYWLTETDARNAARGIWQGRFEEPERWRDRHRNELMRGSMSIDDAVLD